MKLNKYIGYIGSCLIYYAAFLCLATGCNDKKPPVDYTVYLENQSNETIFIGISEGKNVISPAYVFMEGKDLPSLEPGKRFEYIITEWENSHYPNRYYQFIVFKKSTLDNNSRKDIVEKGICDERYIFNFDELEQMNFVITFTGR